MMEVNTSKSEKRVWLVKVPKALANKWHEMIKTSMNATDIEDSAMGAELGRVRVLTSKSKTLEVQGEKISDLKHELHLPGLDGTGQPTNYKMNWTNKKEILSKQGDKVGPMHIFQSSRSPGSGENAMAVLGKVDARFDLQPQAQVRGSGDNQKVSIDPKYCKLQRNRLQQDTNKLRTVKPMDEKGIFLRAPPLVGAGSKRKTLSSLSGRDAKQATKRVAMDVSELENMLFSLFEKQPSWAFGQLQQATNQPQQHLKNVLQGMAVLNKRGPYKDHYTLKKEWGGAKAEKMEEDD